MVGEDLDRSGRNIVIENLTAEDIPSVVEIERSSFTTPWSETSFFNEMKKPRSFFKVAKCGERIVGYICGGWIIDEGHVLDVAVHPDYRRLGIASRLVSLGIDIFREEGCRFVFLEVRDSNEAAKNMYEKFGFEVLGTRKSYYVSPVEDAVIMVFRLGE